MSVSASAFTSAEAHRPFGHRGGVMTSSGSASSGGTKEKETVWLAEGIGVGACGGAEHDIRPDDICAGEELIIAIPGEDHLGGGAGQADRGSRAGHDFAGGENHGGIIPSG